MKKILYMLASLFIVISIVSCEKEKMDNQWNNQSKADVLLKAATSNVESTPISDEGVVPYIIPGANRGGNRTCEEVVTAFNTTFALCGTKLNYGDFDLDGDYEFEGNFPAGLNVNVDGNFISFNANGCISIGGESYKVGAVIIKGASNANVYFYVNGALSDAGLAAPGGLHMVSNLTFCFVKCEEPDLVIAFKSQIGLEWACTVGGPSNLPLNAYYNFVKGFNGKIYYMADVSLPVGNITVDDIDSDGLLEVTIDNSDRPDLKFLHGAFLFVGTLEEYNACTSHYYYPYSRDVYPIALNSLVFDLPF